MCGVQAETIERPRNACYALRASVSGRAGFLFWSAPAKGLDMVLITFAVPCYNAAAWMERCLGSLQVAGDSVEILIMNDGSTDDTGKIADSFEALYPGTARSLNQANSGYGRAVSRCLEEARGLYFKVLDSDDWADSVGLKALLTLVGSFAAGGDPPELIVCDVVYEHLPTGKYREVHFDSVLPAGSAFGWRDLGRFTFAHLLSLHAFVYRTDFLRETVPDIPAHVFYTDNLFAYTPLAKVRSAYYLDRPLYHYAVGRPGQTIEGRVLVTRAADHARVISLLLERIDWNATREDAPNLSKYLERRLSGMIRLNTLIVGANGSGESRTRQLDLWAKLRRLHPKMYSRLRLFAPRASESLPGSFHQLVCGALFGGMYRLTETAFRLSLQRGLLLPARRRGLLSVP